MANDGVAWRGGQSLQAIAQNKLNKTNKPNKPQQNIYHNHTIPVLLCDEFSLFIYPKLLLKIKRRKQNKTKKKHNKTKITFLLLNTALFVFVCV